MSKDHITKENQYDQYNLSKDEILDSWNSQYVKDIRLKMIAGEEITSCEKCTRAESQGLTSMRTTNEKERHVRSTNKDGSINYAPESLELHFGNTCNLQCKMCSQQYSHMVGKELIKMGEKDPEFLKWVKKESGVLNNWTGELEIEYDWYKNEKIKKSIFDHVSKNVERLVVIGGEPTIIREFYQLLEYCNGQNTLRDKELTITTNMTNTSKNLSTWLGAVQHFTIHASIDGLDERNKYIRYPCDWNSVLKSIAFYKENIKKYNNGTLLFAPAIQLLNIDQLPDMCEFFIENFISKDCSISWLSQVRYPIVCDSAILPTEHRLKIADRIETSTKNIDHADTVTKLLGHAADLRTELLSPDEQKTYQKMFIRYNDQQDKFRNSTTWRALLPELEEALTKSLK